MFNMVLETSTLIWLIPLIIWELIWKDIALWRCGRNNQMRWFIAILILNTIGILPIIYLKFFQKKRWPKLWNFPSERCTKFQPYGEYNKGYEVTKSCRLLHPNCSRWSQLLISLNIVQNFTSFILYNARRYTPVVRSKASHNCRLYNMLIWWHCHHLITLYKRRAVILRKNL